MTDLICPALLCRGARRVFLITGGDFRFVVIEQLAGVGIVPSDILVEPVARNTAGAICAAALCLDERSPGVLMLLAPSDHMVPDGEGFRSAVSAPEAQTLRSFVEKPDVATANSLLDGGIHLWNAGIFLFSTTSVLKAFAELAPEVLNASKAAFEAAEMELSFTRLGPDRWQTIPDISIDYAVMERAGSLTVVPYCGAW